MATDAQIRESIRDLLMATNEFDDVLLSEIPDRFPGGAEECRGANIDPSTSDYAKQPWDSGGFDGLLQSSQVSISFFARHQDAPTRDATLEQLLAVAENALNGQSIASATNPAFTGFKSSRFRPATPPDRRLDCIFSYQRLIDSWSTFDASDPGA